jgi:glycerophosphoryl diester phosphodiesterase
MNGNKPLIWAHRGASAYAPENTLEAFKLATDMKSDGVELDVYLTPDGKLTVIHDSDIERTSNGVGKVTELSYDELKKYDFNYGAKFGDKYKNVKIPTLYDVYELLYPTGLTVNVELKASGSALIESVLKCEKDMKMTGRVIYSAFWHHNLTDILEADKDAFVAPLYSNNIVKPWCYAESFGAKALHPHIADVYFIKDYVKNAHDHNIRVHPWTVDDEVNIDKLIELGVDAIITNKPDLALERLNVGK